MVNVLGIKRIIILGALIALNLVVAGLLYGVFKPEEVKKKNELSSVKRQVSTLRNDLSKILVEFEQLETQKEEFATLKQKSFFEEQDRRQAQEILEQIQDASGVISAKASIGGGKTEDHIEAQKSDHKIVISIINIEIAALDDTDIFNYVWLLENKFPGYVDIKEFSYERVEDVDREVLQKISAGEFPQVVKAKISAEWKTMISADDVVGDDDIRGRRR